ncbi:unnamed protein product [Cylicocyclus nassatus]|uniref:Uncharacterized protein n=1 Tax=Cylicocyclus nassatus TaxID=53992 RepID=A0AA36GXX7_CYLNA|nr:unnamed protein product [Cylicocyclus nassatus]
MKVTFAFFWVAVLFFNMMSVYSYPHTRQNSAKKRKDLDRWIRFLKQEDRLFKNNW